MDTKNKTTNIDKLTVEKKHKIVINKIYNKTFEMYK